MPITCTIDTCTYTVQQKSRILIIHGKLMSFDENTLTFQFLLAEFYILCVFSFFEKVYYYSRLRFLNTPNKIEQKVIVIDIHTMNKSVRYMFSYIKCVFFCVAGRRVATGTRLTVQDTDAPHQYQVLATIRIRTTTEPTGVIRLS